MDLVIPAIFLLLRVTWGGVQSDIRSSYPPFHLPKSHAGLRPEAPGELRSPLPTARGTIGPSFLGTYGPLVLPRGKPLFLPNPFRHAVPPSPSRRSSSLRFSDLLLVLYGTAWLQGLGSSRGLPLAWSFAPRPLRGTDRQ